MRNQICIRKDEARALAQFYGPNAKEVIAREAKEVGSTLAVRSASAKLCLHLLESSAPDAAELRSQSRTHKNE